VRVICLKSAATDNNGWDLATVGANARRATEDSTTVGYLAEPNPTPARFSRSILDAAGIAHISTSSGAAAMARLLKLIQRADDSTSPRESVRETLR
jgi:hypothetical protein